MDVPFITAICPTYKRPKCLANAVACFQAQDYPANRRTLIVLDDAGQYKSELFPDWELISIDKRYPNLPAKYNALMKIIPPHTDIVVIWEDDDLYFPQHLKRHVQAMEEGAGWSKPSIVLSLYPGHLVQEKAAGRFHASIAFTPQAFRRAGGYPMTEALEFDQRMFRRLQDANGLPADPMQYGSATYVFRWGSTNAYHGQAYGSGWYEKVGRLDLPVSPGTELIPQFDEEGIRYIGNSLPLDHPLAASSVLM